MGKIKVSMTIDEIVYSDFKDFCKRNGMKISTKVELMMEEIMKNVGLKKFIEK